MSGGRDVVARAQHCREWGNFDDLHGDLLAEVERLRATLNSVRAAATYDLNNPKTYAQTVYAVRDVLEAQPGGEEPRQVATVEELAELPVRTVVKELYGTQHNGAIWERTHSAEADGEWVRLDSGPHVKGRMPFLPALVLWTPPLPEEPKP